MKIMILKNCKCMTETKRAGTCRAACTIDDLIDGGKRALSMTSSMDAQREGTRTHKTGFVHAYDLVGLPANLEGNFYKQAHSCILY
jgi:hypothetical protein